MKTAKQVIHRIKTIAVKEVGGIHFDREEVRALREFAEYCMGIGQDFPRTEARVRLGIGIEYGRERDNAGFWIDSDELGPQEADSPDPTKRIALALIRLAYAVAEKVKPRP